MATREQKMKAFLERANALYDNKYDYSEMEYVNQNTKITIICPEHGRFERTPTYHQRGGDCPECAAYRVANYWTDERREAKRQFMKDPETLERRKQTNRERYGSDSWAASDASKKLREEHKGPWAKESYNKIRQTNMERYGAKTWAESEEGRKLLKEQGQLEEHRKKISEGVRRHEAKAKYKETSLKNHGSEHWTKSDEGKLKLLDINRNYRKSKTEDAVYELLVDVFGSGDVCRQWSDDRYPFNCDFYIKSKDLFIELNAYWMHGGDWFDASRVYHIERLSGWMAIDKPMYKRAIDTWTIRDVDKRHTAKVNDLNYVVFWKNDLSDVKTWIANGCPNRKDWK